MVEKDPLADEMAQQETGWEITKRLTREVLESLSEPFPEDAIGWKAQALYPKDKPTTALAVPHITARHVMNRLDEVVGPAGWQTDFEFIPGLKAAKVMLTVLGVTKSDIGFVAGDDDAAIKGSVSDGLKRAAVLFGIGRYLYEAEAQWVDWDNKKRKFAKEPRLILKNSTLSQHRDGRRPAEARQELETAPQPAPLAKKARKTPPLPGEKPEKVSVGLIQEETNAQLEAMGYEAHYKSRVQTIKAMEACGYDKGTAQKYLGENFADIVACLVDRVEEKEATE